MTSDIEISGQLDDTTIDTIAERIFCEADGDRLRAFDLARQYTYPDYAPIHSKVLQKFVAIEEAAAERIYAEAAGDRDRAFQLAREFTGLRHRYEIDNILRRKFQAADDEAADALAERCYREAGGDHR